MGIAARARRQGARLRARRSAHALVRALAVFSVAYAPSPIDLIPDAIPVLGLLDELLLLPPLIALALRLIPAPVMADCRARAATPSPVPAWLRWTGLAIIVAIRCAAAFAIAHWV